MLCSHDLAELMDRSESSVACFLGLSRPRHVKWTPVRLKGTKNPRRFYELNGILSWLAQSYIFFDRKLEEKLRQRSAENCARFGDAAQ